MRKMIVAGMLLLVLTLIFIGCTPAPPETTMQSTKQPTLQTEQQILDEHPDNLDQALEELEMVE